MTGKQRRTRLTVPGDLGGLERIAEPVGSRVFTTTYYDTPAHAIAAAGISLHREVENGKSNWRLALPRGQEVLVAGGPARPPATIRGLLVAVVREAPLEPVATLRTRRSTLRVRERGADAADVVADSVAVMEGRRVAEAFSEIEVSPLNGDRAVVQRLVKRLLREGAEPGERRPALLRTLGLRPGPTPVGRPSREPLEQVGAMLGEQMQSMQSHDPGVRIGSDPEDLHRLRVAVRRARAILRVARPLFDEEWAETLRGELRWVGGMLGPVRDLDVLLQHLRDEVGTLDADEAFAAERLVYALEAEREVARAAMLEALESERYLALLDALAAAARQPRASGRDVDLPALAAAEFARLRKAAKTLRAPLSNQELHRLRIHAKRARYVAELVARGGDKRAKRFVGRARKFQDVVGGHQDAVVASARLRDLAECTRGDRVAFATGRLVEREEIRRHEARAAVPRAWRKLERAGRRAWA